MIGTQILNKLMLISSASWGSWISYLREYIWSAVEFYRLKLNWTCSSTFWSILSRLSFVLPWPHNHHLFDWEPDGSPHIVSTSEPTFVRQFLILQYIFILGLVIWGMEKCIFGFLSFRPFKNYLWHRYWFHMMTFERYNSSTCLAYVPNGGFVSSDYWGIFY